MARGATEQREHLQALIHRAEALGKSDPAAYRRRVLLLALLGYGVLFGLLFVLLTLLVGGVWAALTSSALLILLIKSKLIFVLAYLAYALLRSLWVRVDAPQGYALDLRRAPALAAELHDLRRALATPRIHQVLISDAFNAGIHQTPRLGVFGWNRNTLVLGLPLLLALSPRQARAVLAHELGHLSGNHSRFGAWIYRVRLTWERVMSAFGHGQHWATRWLGRFFEWYSPHFNAYSFALARANEYEADALSARLTSREDAAQALMAAHVAPEHLGQAYWQPFIARAQSEARPAGDPYRGLARFLDDQGLALHSGLESALAAPTGYADTHPALKDRLAALDAARVQPAPLDSSAARHWLGEQYDKVLADFDQDWFKRNGEAWVARYQEAEAARATLAQLMARAPETLNPMELWQRAALSEQLGGDALPLYRAYAEAHPEDPDADLALGRLLLERDDPAGLPHIERAATHFKLTLHACEIARAYFARLGDAAQAEIWLRRGEAQFDLENAGRAERASVGPKDELWAGGLSDEQLAQLARQLAAIGGVKRAWICRKAVKVLPEEAPYVLAFQPDGWFAKESKRVPKLAEKIVGPGLTFIVMKGGRAGKLAKRVIKIGQRIAV